jgi:hypothetical protein
MIRRVESQAINGIAIFFINFQPNARFLIFCGVSQAAAATGHHSSSLGHFAKSWNLAFLVLIFLKMQILRFHDITKIRC